MVNIFGNAIQYCGSRFYIVSFFQNVSGFESVPVKSHFSDRPFSVNWSTSSASLLLESIFSSLLLLDIFPTFVRNNLPWWSDLLWSYPMFSISYISSIYRNNTHTYIVWLEVDFLGIKTDTTTLKVTRIDLKTLNMKSEPEFKTFDTIVSTKSHEYMQDEARDCV